MHVTVGVATCGRPEALARCLAAIVAQTRRPDQIIVVDQSPSQAVHQVIETCGFTVDYLEQPRLGLSASRNLALSHACCTLLAVTDDDCFPDDDWLAALVGAFELEPKAAAVTGPILAPLGEPPRGMHAFSLRASQGPSTFNGRIIPWHVGSGANFAARVESLRQVGGWDVRLGVGSRGQAAEDCDLIDRLLAAGELIRYEPAAIMRHDWQSNERRAATRWSYGYGIGALCGLRLAERDGFGVSMMASYSKRHALMLMREIGRRRWPEARQRLTALTGFMPGLIYGLRARGKQRTS